MIQHIFQHFAIIHIGGSEADNKRNSIAIRYEMMWVTPKFCVKFNERRNRAKFICRRQRLDRLPPMSTT